MRINLWKVVGLVGVAACQIEGADPGQVATKRPPRIEEVRLDRATAARTVWNPGPGDPAAMGTVTPTTFALVGSGIDVTATKRSLILYDQSGNWGALGELYAIGAANLASHFGTWVSKPIATYTCGELASYDAAIYIGSSYGESIPTCFFDNVLAGTKPVIWAFYNVWQMTDYYGHDAFTAAFGWNWTGFDFSSIGAVEYKGHKLDRYAANGSGLLGTVIADPAKATVLATAYRADGSTLPWALRSGNLTYVADIPFSYMKEEDRYLAFADLLFDALAPSTQERHRVVVRIEDITPVDDPTELRGVAEYLFAQGIPYGYGVISEYRDPLGWYNGGVSERVRLDQAPEVVAVLDYMRSHGGTPIMHGYTHQFKSELNPYTAVSGDDTEFYRVTENLDHTLNYSGPLPGDSSRYTLDRIDSARKNFNRAHEPQPAIFEFPHYVGSAVDYRAVGSRFTTRWERSVYFPGVLAGRTATYQYMFGQLFPYPVRDVYGSRVLPEDLGNIEPVPFYIFPTRFPADIVNAAEKNLVVRDGTAGFYFHSFFDIQYLKDTVEGLRALGYTFVDPNTL